MQSSLLYPGDDSVMDSEIELSGYVVQRKDHERSGGGVCMYIRSDLAFNPHPELSTDQLETLWIEILLPKTKPVLVCVCYRPPHQNDMINSLRTRGGICRPRTHRHADEWRQLPPYD